jgi:hypothetical protein
VRRVAKAAYAEGNGAMIRSNNDRNTRLWSQQERSTNTHFLARKPTRLISLGIIQNPESLLEVNVRNRGTVPFGKEDFRGGR